MKNNVLFVLVGLVIAVAVTTAVQANPISGTISFSGAASASESGGVTTFAPNSPWLDVLGTGDYSLTTLSDATFNPISYTGTGTAATLTGAVDPLWTLTVLGATYSFNLTSLDSADVTDGSVAMNGTGVANITGFDATDASWSLEGAGANETFTIDFTTTSTTSGDAGGSVPDGGMTVAMLGLALGICGLFARKFQCA